MIKLATQSSEKMIESSNMRASSSNTQETLSADKRERDMPENCLLKIKPTISPPPPTLSKAVAEDMKLKLLTRMKDLLNQGLKFQTLRAWGWFIRFPGSQAMKYRQLTNDLNMQSRGENQTRVFTAVLCVSKAA